MNDRHVQTKCSEWSLWPVPGGSLESALEYQGGGGGATTAQIVQQIPNCQAFI